MLADTRAVAAAAGLGKFALLGISQGCAFSIRYAVEHPDQVHCLVLLGGYLRGRLRRPMQEQKQLFEMLTTMIRDGWGSPNPVFRHFFTSNFIPDASPEAANSFDELQRIATSPESALRIWEMTVQVDVVEMAKQVRVPTLVLHCKGDRVVPPEEGRHIARLIPGASSSNSPATTSVLDWQARPPSTSSSKRQPPSSRPMPARCSARARAAPGQLSPFWPADRRVRC